MAGHLFITRGDIRHLACHAWLLPTDQRVKIEDVWRRGDPRIAAALDADRHVAIRNAAQWRNRQVLAAPFLPRDGERGEVWLGNIGGTAASDLKRIVDSVEEFVRGAASNGAEVRDDDRRDRPLLAIPFVGTRKGGAANRKGEVVRTLLERLTPILESVDADVVLVTRNDEALAAAQLARRRPIRDWPGWWKRAFNGPRLPYRDVYELGARLGDHARRGRLVLFVGAGVSASAGLPQWEALLNELAEDVLTQPAALKRLPFLDRATVIETALSRHKRTIGDAIAKRIAAGGPYGLAHSLIATLPTTEMVTTNYDTLLEKAAADAGRKLTILDSRTVVGADRWLLKLHGSIDRPNDIVLSREDYLGYGQRRAALRGVVQAMLLTRHMLFVGFGLSDDNFHVIAHQVRSALRGGGRRKGAGFGTALLVRDNPLFDELWHGDIEPAALGAERAKIGVGARRVELLLDLVLAESHGGLSHFMDPTFNDLLDESERDLRDGLQALSRSPHPETPAWQALAELMKRLGGP